MGASGGFFSASWGPLGALLGCLGSLLRRFRPSWTPPGPSWGRLRRSWAALGAVWRVSWAVLGASGAVLGPSWGRLGPSWGPHGGILGRSWGLVWPSWTRRRRKTRECRKCQFSEGNGTIFASWGSPGGSSWAVVGAYWPGSGASGAVLGLPGRARRPSWRPLEPLRAVLRPCEAVLRHLGPRPGACGGSGRPRRSDFMHLIAHPSRTRLLRPCSID